MVGGMGKESFLWRLASESVCFPLVPGHLLEKGVFLSFSLWKTNVGYLCKFKITFIYKFKRFVGEKLVIKFWNFLMTFNL